MNDHDQPGKVALDTHVTDLTITSANAMCCADW
jgi:hypothetical protein